MWLRSLRHLLRMQLCPPGNVALPVGEVGVLLGVMMKGQFRKKWGQMGTWLGHLAKILK